MMAERIAISPDSAVAVTEASRQLGGQAGNDWGRQVQFGMSFEEQQEVIYQALMSFEEPEK